MLPLFGAVGVVAGAIGAIAIVRATKRKLRGTRFAVLGPRASGKTTLIDFLANGSIPAGYVATEKPKRVEGKTIALDALKLKIATMVDLPGEAGWHDAWESAFKDADVVCYLFDAARFTRESDYLALVDGEMRKLGDWLKPRKAKPPHFFLIATHCDLLAKPVDDAAFWRAPDAERLLHRGHGTMHVTGVTGSMADLRRTKKLVGSLLARVAA